MDLIPSCKDKLAHFRVKELKDVLTRLGLSKQGKKQDLVDRVLGVLSDKQVSAMWAKRNAVGKEEVAKIVDDTYRKMQVSGATDLASIGQGSSDSNTVTFREEIDDALQMDEIRCPCGSSLQNGPMIKCEDPSCGVQQHVNCVIIQEKPTDTLQPVLPEIFYCELCRLSRADPFWSPVAFPLYPVKLTIADVPTEGTNPVQSVERTFQLTRADKDLLSKQEYDVQAWCMLLNDKVPFRMHWPQYADLQVNGIPWRAINRPGSQLLGANGRDDGPVITQCTRDGINKVSLTGCDARVFCMGVRIVKRHTMQQILSLIPKESDGEQFEDALARVRRCIGGATENADSDSDLEVVADFIPVNLRCPMSGLRMKIAGRFKPCIHMGCFDLEVFVEMNQRSRKWQCPICLKNYSLENLVIDPYFNRITSKMRNFGEDVVEIEVKPDGCWRAKAEGDCKNLGDLGKWHFPDGSLTIPADEETKPKSEFQKLVKQEAVSEAHTSLRIGIRKNRDGFWEVSKHESNRKIENLDKNVIPMSCSAPGSATYGDDTRINHDDGGKFDFPTNSEVDLDSIPDVDPTSGVLDYNASTDFRENEVIVLSDSDDENANLVSNQNSNVGVPFPGHTHGISNSYREDPVLATSGASCLGLFNSSDDEFMQMWSLPPGNQGCPGFQLFGSDADVSDSLVDPQHGSIDHTSLVNEYNLTSETPIGSAAFVPAAPFNHSNANTNDRLLDSSLDIGADDPSLQIFLPTGPSSPLANDDFKHQSTVSNGMHKDDWISLSLGNGDDGAPNEQMTQNALSSIVQAPFKEGRLDSLEETASLMLGVNDNISVKTSRERSDGPFSFPRQRRSVRQRLYLSIDSDSE